MPRPEGPRAAKEALCLRPYMALQAPSLAARRRCYFQEPALRLGLTQSRKGVAYAQARWAATNGRAGHKRLLCQQRSAATIRPAIISCHGQRRMVRFSTSSLTKATYTWDPVPRSEWHIPRDGQGPAGSSAGSSTETCKKQRWLSGGQNTRQSRFSGTTQ